MQTLLHNRQHYVSKITHAKLSKPARMFQWDAVDTNPDLVGQNVLKTFKMAIQHNRRTTRTELERVLCRWIYSHLRLKIFPGPLAAVRGRSPPSPSPPIDPPLSPCCGSWLVWKGHKVPRENTFVLEIGVPEVSVYFAYRAGVPGQGFLHSQVSIKTVIWHKTYCRCNVRPVAIFSSPERSLIDRSRPKCD